MNNFLRSEQIIRLAPCPVCFVDKEVACVDVNGKERKQQHKPRLEAARNALAMPNSRLESKDVELSE